MSATGRGAPAQSATADREIVDLPGHQRPTGAGVRVDQAREAAGYRDVRIAGGGATILEYVSAGLTTSSRSRSHPCYSAPESACSRA
jgi:hypothetical protein